LDFRTQTINKFDHHVHFGQFHDVYYSPADIVQTLAKNGIRGAYVSSTTSCLNWTTKEEKDMILTHIHDEILESLHVGKRIGVDVVPLYWVIPKQIFEGTSIKTIFEDTPYRGFKLHTRVYNWNFRDNRNSNLMREICEYANEFEYPILIHTGLDDCDSPTLFSEFFSKYSRIKFILAHCKNTSAVIQMFSMYKNVYGDTSFCPEESFQLICKSGFRERMLYGTDYPISARNSN